MTEMPLRLSPAMTSRKLQVLGFIKRYYLDHGKSPTLGEIAAGVNITRQRAHKLVRSLDADGDVRRTAGKARGIMLRDPVKQLSEIDALRQLQQAGWSINGAQKELLGPLTKGTLPLRPQLDHNPSVETGVVDGSSSGRG